MAELFLLGQIKKAVDFDEPNLYCKWSLQTGKAWSLLQGEAEGQTFTSSSHLQRCCDFSHPVDTHYSTVSVQGWPKLHVEVYAVNVLQHSWPVGYGYIHLPTKPGQQRLVINTWKVAPNSWWNGIKEKFGGGGTALNKHDLIYAGVERYKLQTYNSGKIIVDIQLVFRGFSRFGVEYK